MYLLSNLHLFMLLIYTKIMYGFVYRIELEASDWKKKNYQVSNFTWADCIQI